LRSGWFCDIFALPSTFEMTSSTPTIARSCARVAFGRIGYLPRLGAGLLVPIRQHRDEVEHPVHVVVRDEPTVDVEYLVVPGRYHLAGFRFRRVEAG